MRLNAFAIAIVAYLIGGIMILPAAAASSRPFIVYYGSDNDPALSQYDTLVFDADHHPSLAPLTNAGKIVLGYLSLGEVESSRSYYDQVRKAGLLLKKNKNWPDSKFIDVRDPRWSDLVTGTLVPRILAQGFSGLFLDTLDDPADLERRAPKRFKGMTEASIRLVKSIRAAHPGIPIMLNRAYEILPEVAGDITMELAESMLSDYDFSTKTYRLVPAADVAQQRSLIAKIKASHPDLALYSLDYWWPSQPEEIHKIYAMEEKAGFMPYVATVDLDQIVPFP